MSPPAQVRPIHENDFAGWMPLWQDYNAFYGRAGATALPDAVTRATWQRFFNPDEPVFALVAEFDGVLVGLTHCLFHRSTTRLELSCYLQDLFTAQSARGQGIGRALVEGVYALATTAGINRVYWMTHASNTPGRLLYDKIASHAGFIVYAHES